MLAPTLPVIYAAWELHLFQHADGCEVESVKEHSSVANLQIPAPL